MRTIKLMLGIAFITSLTACQTTPNAFNGVTGYQVESVNKNSATLAYTLAARKDRQLDEIKLQRACQKVLQTQQQYKLTILSINEIANPEANKPKAEGIQLGHSRTSIGLSNTPAMSSTNSYAERDALETRQSMLQVVRYTCS